MSELGRRLRRKVDDYADVDDTRGIKGRTVQPEGE
jgi:hypothetical protein